MGSGLRLAALVVAVGTLFSAPAGADQITLTGGSLDLLLSSGGSAVGRVQLTGERGFSFLGSIAAGFEAPIGEPLVPGSTVTLQGASNGLDLQGTVTLDGVTYNGVGGLDSPAGASLRFVTTAALPSVLSPPSSIAAAFMLGLVFSDGQADHSLSGSGLATIFLDEDRGFGVPSWRVTGIRADVASTPAPVPEPATLFLAASGLAWVAARRRRA